MRSPGRTTTTSPTAICFNRAAPPLAVSVTNKRLPGHQFRERANGAPGLVHRVGLENIAERVDEDQDGRFTPQAEHHGAAGTDQHEEVDGRRQVDKGDQRLPRRIIDAGEDREHVRARWRQGAVRPSFPI